MPSYHPIFQTGETVSIANRRTLKKFKRSWKFHHPLDESQLEFAGGDARITQTLFYHGGDVLHTLEIYRFEEGYSPIPGVWHERLLVDDQFGWKKEPAIDYFEIQAETRNNEPYVVVYCKKQKIELLVTRQRGNRMYADAMIEIAKLRDRSMFASRYGFTDFDGIDNPGICG